MADKKISELATATTSIGGYIPIVIGGVTKKCLTNAGAGTLDADTVSGYGIGVEVPDMGASFAAAILSGHFKYGASTTSAPTTNAGTVIVVAGSVTDEFYAHDNTTYIMYHGYRAHGTGAPTWEKVWTPSSDGNGGQPPAPKPRNSVGNVGHWQYGGATLPGTGTFATISFKTGLFFASDGDIQGGANMNTYYSTTGITAVMWWRTA